mgnify:CR=1 FL=1
MAELNETIDAVEDSPVQEDAVIAEEMAEAPAEENGALAKVDEIVSVCESICQAISRSASWMFQRNPVRRAIFAFASAR